MDLTPIISGISAFLQVLWSLQAPVQVLRFVSASDSPLCALSQVMKDFEELPSQAAGALRASLLNLLLAFGRGAASVKIQLCLALAAVAVHMPAAKWDGGRPCAVAGAADGACAARACPALHAGGAGGAARGEPSSSSWRAGC